MENSKWWRLALVGIVLLVLGGAILLASNRKDSTQISQIASPIPIPSPEVASPSPASAADALAGRVLSSSTQLPATGFPTGAVLIFSLAAISIGVGLRKFPH